MKNFSKEDRDLFGCFEHTVPDAVTTADDLYRGC